MKPIIKRITATGLGLTAAVLASGCAVDAVSEGEALGEVQEAFTFQQNGICSTHTQIGAEIIRTAMIDLGRYRPGLDLHVNDTKQGFPVELTQTGQDRCASRSGKCRRLKSLLSYQYLTPTQTAALSGEFPWMNQLQTVAISNGIGNTMPRVSFPNPNQVMTHNLAFAYTAPAAPIADCSAVNLKYHCFTVSGLPTGKTTQDLANQLSGLLQSEWHIASLTRIFRDGNDKLCIDPDGAGDDQTGGGSTGGSTCVDGTMAIMYDPSYVGECCTMAAGSGYLVQSGADPGYMSCKLTNLAADKVATGSSTLSGYPTSNMTDSNLSSLWKASTTATGQWGKVDLGVSQSIKGVVFKLESAGAYGYKVETSTNNSIWITKKQGTTATTATSQDANFPATSARYVRVTFTSLPAGRSAAISSVRVYN